MFRSLEKEKGYAMLEVLFAVALAGLFLLRQ